MIIQIIFVLSLASIYDYRSHDYCIHQCTLSACLVWYGKQEPLTDRLVDTMINSVVFFQEQRAAVEIYINTTLMVIIILNIMRRIQFEEIQLPSIRWFLLFYIFIIIICNNMFLSSHKNIINIIIELVWHSYVRLCVKCSSLTCADDSLSLLWVFGNHRNINLIAELNKWQIEFALFFWPH